MVDFLLLFLQLLSEVLQLFLFMLSDEVVFLGFFSLEESVVGPAGANWAIAGAIGIESGDSTVSGWQSDGTSNCRAH